MDFKLRFNTRKPAGASFVALVLVVAFFVVLPLSMLGFELSRFMLMQQQLHNVTDAAALAGTAAMATSNPNFTLAQNETIAMQVAADTFIQNSILQTAFNTNNVTANLNQNQNQNPPQPYNATLNITLLDRNGSPVTTGSTAAATMRVEGIYSDSPIFVGNLLSIARVETAYAASNGGLPQLDVILCFDISGSMDDQTPVYFVNRYYDGISTVQYLMVSSGQTIYNSNTPPDTGTPLNASQPQNLSKASWPVADGGNVTPFLFSEIATNPVTGLANGYNGLRALAPLNGTLVPEQGRPPGNYPNLLIGGLNPTSNAPGYSNPPFTDMVVNVGAPFNNVQSCVEASRGNLENQSVLLASQGGSNINPAIQAPFAGAYNKYWSMVNQQVSPMSQALAAGTQFFTTMYQSTNAHFGLVSFCDQVGTSPTSGWNDPPYSTVNNIDFNWTGGGQYNPPNGFPLPSITLSQTIQDGNYSAVLAALNGSGNYPPVLPVQMNALGGTDIADSLAQALSEVTNPNDYRNTAKRAIVLFTDGVPNLPGGAGAARLAALAQGSDAGHDGIPIYTIGLSTNPIIQPEEDSLLGDGVTGGQGIAWESGHGAIYVRVTDPTQLESAFQTIARSLVVLQ